MFFVVCPLAAMREIDDDVSAFVTAFVTAFAHRFEQWN